MRKEQLSEIVRWVARKCHLGKVRPLQPLVRFLVDHLKSSKTVIFGHQMFLDKNDSLALSVYGRWEPLETQIATSYLKQGSTVIDIGAHIGYYTLLFARAVGSTGKVIAVEPDPQNLSLLRKNISANGYENVEVLPYAASDISGEEFLYVREKKSTGHSLVFPEYQQNKILVNSIRLADAGLPPKIDLIKMDIQGGEVKTLIGMLPIIQENPAIRLITEFWPYALEKSGFPAKEYLRILEVDCGFYLFDIDESKKQMNPSKTVDLLKRYTVQARNSTNLLCSKVADG